MTMVPPTPDRALLDAWIAGQDEAALGELMQRHRPMLVALARRVLRDPAGAEDVAQEVFTRLSEDAGGITGPVDAWLRTATGNLAISHLRSRLRRRRREAEAVVPDQDQGDHLEDAELRLQVNESVAALTPAEQDLIIRVFWLGHTMEAIAREQRVSRVAISKRVHRSMERMRSRLHRRGVRLGLAAFALLLGGGSRLPAEVAALARPAIAGLSVTSWAGILAAMMVTGVGIAILPARARAPEQAAPIRHPALPATAAAAATPLATLVGHAPPTAIVSNEPAKPPCWLHLADTGWFPLDLRTWRFAGIETDRPADDHPFIYRGFRGRIGPLTLGSPEVRLAIARGGPFLRLEALPSYPIICSLPTGGGTLAMGIQVVVEARAFANPRPPRGPQHRTVSDARWRTHLITTLHFDGSSGTEQARVLTTFIGEGPAQSFARRSPLAETDHMVLFLRDRFNIMLSEPLEIGQGRMRFLAPAERLELLRLAPSIVHEPVGAGF